MSLPQTQLLSHTGLSVLRGWILETASQFLLFGIHVTLSVVVLCLSTRKGVFMSKARVGLALFTIMMLLISLLAAILNTESIIVQIPHGFDLKQIIPSRAKTMSLNLLVGLNCAISDVVVVWRAWVLFPRSRIVKIALSVCLVSSFAGAFLEGGIAAKGFKNNLNLQSRSTETMILTIPLIFTNLVATVLIGYKTW
ncbi:hypothetical protein K435DRAFT_854030 [Dendrothele bispora CBS 962.96]|uniref:Uncharacterized protein n=1 Tax=Dendrothele bispora (strain CBS 962.96) TaxID=1314807 RepID=A0A4S8MEX4_DENBC|nr:hypothetical protein K435DRAFT_854030 [Dendrothele bispora CBS 962.96]